MNAAAPATAQKFAPTLELLESLGFEKHQGIAHRLFLNGKSDTAIIDAFPGNSYVTVRTFENGHYHDATDSVLRLLSEQNLRDFIEMARPE